MARKLPAHIPGSIRAWRAKKRRELRAVESALWTVLQNARFTPARSEIAQMLSLVINARQKLRGEWEP
jgi:hypothetical protein